MSPEAFGPRRVERRPVVIVGGGLSGMVLALDLARRGQRVTVLEASDGVVRGSRTITYAPTTLEILCVLGCEKPILEQAFRWSTGTEFVSDRKLRSVTHARSSPERFTSYHSLPQPIVHDSLMAKIKAALLVDLRLECEVTDVSRDAAGLMRVHAARGGAAVEFLCDYLVAADGAHSLVRRRLGLSLNGDRVAEKFLGCDLDTAEKLASDRTVWFDPPFAEGKSALLLKYGDCKYRFDVHMPAWDTRMFDEAAVRGVIGEAFGSTLNYRLDFWSTFHISCQMLDEFRHGPVFFIGDAAHLVPPYGARGGNSGVADAFNLSWKLAGVLQGRYAKELLLTYGTEMQEAARQNLNEAGKSMRFLVPQTALDRAIRNAALALCKANPLALQIVNSGTMSRPCHYTRETQVHVPDRELLHRVLPVINKIPNFHMGLKQSWAYLHDCLGAEFTAVVFARSEAAGRREARRLETALAECRTPLSVLVVVEEAGADAASPVLRDSHDTLKAYLGGRGDVVLLVRPDRYLLSVVAFHETAALTTLLRATSGALRFEPIAAPVRAPGRHDDHGQSDSSGAVVAAPRSEDGEARVP